jgi:hypothetical protein
MAGAFVLLGTKSTMIISTACAIIFAIAQYVVFAIYIAVLVSHKRKQPQARQSLRL